MEILRLVALWLIAAPILTFLHEMGHASAAMVLTDGDVRVWVGRQDQEPTMRFGRLLIRVTPFSGFTGFYAFDTGEYSRAARVVIMLAGPLSSLLVSVVFAVVARLDAVEHSWAEPNLLALANVSGLIFLATIVPFRYPSWWGGLAGVPSDGLRVIHVLREAPESASSRIA